MSDNSLDPISEVLALLFIANLAKQRERHLSEVLAFMQRKMEGTPGNAGFAEKRLTHAEKKDLADLCMRQMRESLSLLEDAGLVKAYEAENLDELNEKRDAANREAPAKAADVVSSERVVADLFAKLKGGSL